MSHPDVCVVNKSCSFAVCRVNQDKFAFRVGTEDTKRSPSSSPDAQYQGHRRTTRADVSSDVKVGSGKTMRLVRQVLLILPDLREEIRNAYYQFHSGGETFLKYIKT